MPGPVASTGDIVGQQPGRRQFPQPLPHGIGTQPGDRVQQVLSQRPARDRQPGQHRSGVTGAAARPRRQQLRQPGWQPGRNLQRARCPAGHRRGHQLLGEKRVSLRPRIQFLNDLRRHRAAAPQVGDLYRHLRRRQRAQPDLLGLRRAAHIGQPAHHMRC